MRDVTMYKVKKTIVLNLKFVHQHVKFNCKLKCEKEKSPNCLPVFFKKNTNSNFSSSIRNKNNSSF